MTCDGCGHPEHDAWGCRERAYGSTANLPPRCTCDYGNDGQGDLDTDDDRGVTHAESQAARLRATGHYADKGWDVV